MERVAASSSFQKSNRLRELLLFLCERALADPNGMIREVDIGTGVFGRQPGYDTAQDPLVRVQVSQLRKKLQQYFLEEGQNEPFAIEIPKGAYTPVFSPRPVEASEPDAGRPRRAAWLGRNRLTLALALVAAASLSVAAWALFRPAPLRLPGRAAGAGPEVDRLWSQLFDNGRPSAVVLSDPCLVLYESLIRHQLTLHEYRNKYFDALANEYMSEPVANGVAKTVSQSVCTHVADAQLAAVFSLFNAAHGVSTEIVYAREFAVTYLSSHNVIVLGSRRANPWVEYFETLLNFRSEFEEAGASKDSAPVSYFRNVSPRPGESARYATEWGQRGFCRVASLPNPTRSGSVLVISGTDMAATEAGGEFIASDSWIRALESTLRVAPGARFPYFEVLLKTEYAANNSAPRFAIVAHRIVRP
ncbi:MAG TPA: hypothetical protein VHA11_01430 [Bryobacteraceae bacterium]|nr:hypothetical protein [Bryobacteraceae bacterium]